MFRSKKKKNKDKSEITDENTTEQVDNKEDVKVDTDLSDEDKEVLAITGDTEKHDSPSVPSITTTKPPLPGESN